MEVRSINDFDATVVPSVRMRSEEDRDDADTEEENEEPMEEISLDDDDETVTSNDTSSSKNTVSSSSNSEASSQESIGTTVEGVIACIRRGRSREGEDIEEAIVEQTPDHDSTATIADIQERERSIAELIEMIHGQRQMDNPDREMLLRLKDFRTARLLRNETYSQSPWGIYGAFSYLADLRLDIEWSEDAAYRRKTKQPYLAWIDFDRLYSQVYSHPFFTYLLMLASTAMMFVAFAKNGWKIAKPKVNPMIGPSPEVLLELGALSTLRIVEMDEWYRLISPIVLHAGIIHYVLNIFGLWFLGSAVERMHGLVETAFVFLLSAIGGNIASALFMPNALSVGASGGIFGLFGICLADIVTNWDLIKLADKEDENHNFPYRKAIFWMSFEVIASCVIGLTPYVDNFAHSGGLLYGVCAGLFLFKRMGGTGFFGAKSKRRRLLFWRIFGLVLAIAAFTSTAIFLVRSDGSSDTVCNKCRHISCVPFPFWNDDPWWRCDSCDGVSGTLFRLTNTSQLDLNCPYGEIVTIDLMEPGLSPNVVMDRLPGLCRTYCEGQ